MTMTVGPIHPYVGPGSICLLCQDRVAMEYSHLCRQCDTTLGEELAPRCVAPIRCYCPEHLGRREPRRPKADSIRQIKDDLAARRTRKALADAGYSPNQIALMEARERNAK